MNCTICLHPIDETRDQPERTGGSLPDGHAHGLCFWRRTAYVRLGQLEAARDRAYELEQQLRHAVTKPWWKRMLNLQ